MKKILVLIIGLIIPNCVNSPYQGSQYILLTDPDSAYILDILNLKFNEPMVTYPPPK